MIRHLSNTNHGKI